MKNILSFLFGVLVASMWWITLTIEIAFIPLAVVLTIAAGVSALIYFLDNWNRLI